MRRLRLGTTGLAAALLLIIPGTASAGMGEVVDIIIGLTGPQMVGIPLDCELNLETHDTACFLAGVRIPRAGTDFKDGFLVNRRLWLSLGGAAWLSTGKNPEGRDFEFSDVWMLGLEPMLNYRSFKTENNRFFVEHGAGMSFLLLYGEGPPDEENFDTFGKFGFKLKPVAITWRNIPINRKPFDFGVAYNLRIFPSAFTAEQFGAAAGTTSHGGREIAHGVAVTFGF